MGEVRRLGEADPTSIPRGSACEGQSGRHSIHRRPAVAPHARAAPRAAGPAVTAAVRFPRRGRRLCDLGGTSIRPARRRTRCIRDGGGSGCSGCGGTSIRDVPEPPSLPLPGRASAALANTPPPGIRCDLEHPPGRGAGAGRCRRSWRPSRWTGMPGPWTSDRGVRPVGRVPTWPTDRRAVGARNWAHVMRPC
jgi:hypothetical protein